MAVILSEILSCLVVAALIGFATAWALRAVSERTALHRLEGIWRGRARDLETRLAFASDSLREQTERGAQLAGQLEDAAAALRTSESTYAEAEARGAVDRVADRGAAAERGGDTASEEGEALDGRVARLRAAHDALERDIDRIRMLVALRAPEVSEQAPQASGEDAAQDSSRRSMDTLFGVPTPEPDPEHVVSDIESALQSLRDGIALDDERARWLAERVGELGPIAERLHERADALVANGGTAELDGIVTGAESSSSKPDVPGPDSDVIQDELDELRALIEHRRSTIDRLESDYAEAALDPGIAGQLLRLETQIARLSGEVTQRDGSIADLSERMRSAAERKAQAARESERLAAEREHLTAQLRERDDYIDALEVDLQSTSRGQNAEIDSLRRKLTELESAPPGVVRSAVGIVRSMPDPAAQNGAAGRVAEAPRTPDQAAGDRAQSEPGPLLADDASLSVELPRGDLAVGSQAAAADERVASGAQARPVTVSGDSEPWDDLKQVRGIGPVIERTLNGLGIRTFRQIARWTPDDVAEIERHLASFRNRVRRDDWISGAREQHRIKYGELP